MPVPTLEAKEEPETFLDAADAGLDDPEELIEAVRNPLATVALTPAVTGR